MKKNQNTAPVVVRPDLELHEASVADAPALYNLINSGRHYLREWLPFIDYSQSVADTELFLSIVTASDNKEDQVYTIRYKGRVAGIIGYKTIDRVNHKLEIGYWLGEEYQGKGIMLHSCEAMVRHAFEQMRMNRVQLKVAVGNSKSSRIPQQLGFQLEGIERNGEWLRGSFVDLEVYSLLKREWQAQQTTSDSGGNGPVLI